MQPNITQVGVTVDGADISAAPAGLKAHRLYLSLQGRKTNMNKKWEGISKQAAINASRALSKMIDRPVKVEIAKAVVQKVERLSPLIGPEEIVAGIYLPITGDIKGASLLIFPQLILQIFLSQMVFQLINQF